MKVVVFGNCQRKGVANALATMAMNELEIIAHLNTSRAGSVASNEVIEKDFSDADLIVYQPLNDRHYFNSAKMCEFTAEKIRIPYFFNEGITSLGYAPKAQKNSYGQIYGEEIIIELLKTMPYDQVIKMYQNGEIDFNLKARFDNSLQILRSRETECEVKLSDFIEQNYKDIFLFISHNHPTSVVFNEMARQIFKITSLPYKERMHWLNIDSYPCTGAPYSPYDTMIHGFSFGFHSDWFERGKRLLQTIYDHHICHTEKKLKVNPPSDVSQPFPDSCFCTRSEHANHNAGSLCDLTACRGYSKQLLLSILEHPGPLSSSVKKYCTQNPSNYDSDNLLEHLVCNSSEFACSSIKDQDDKHFELLPQNEEEYELLYLNKLCVSFILDDELSMAENILKRLDKIGRADEITCIEFSKFYQRNGWPKQAIKKAQDAIAIKDDHPDFYHHLGSLLRNTGDLEGAEVALEKAVALDPLVPGPHIQLSHIYNQRGDVEQAIKKAQDAIAIKDNHSGFYHHLGNLLRYTGDLEGAEEAQEKAVTLDPLVPGPHIQLSHIYNQRGDTEQAIKKAHDAIAIKDDHPGFYHHLGNLLKKTGDLEGAEEAQGKAVALDPSILGSQRRLSHIKTNVTRLGRLLRNLKALFLS